MLNKSLVEMGFTLQQAKIYIALLKAGPCLLKEISDLTQIKRTTLYAIIDAMADQGYIHIVIIGKRKKYQAQEPEKILEGLKQRENIFVNLIPALHGLAKKDISFKPVIKFFHGKIGIKAIYEDSLINCEKGDQILAYVGGTRLLSSMPIYTRQYIDRRAKRGILLKAITEDSKEVREVVRCDKEQLRETKFVPKEKWDLVVEKMIYKDKMVIASYHGYLMAMLVQSKELARAERSIFNLLWDLL